MIILVITTCATREEADGIAQHCIINHLAGCVHIDEVTSTYLWEGQLRIDHEFRLLIKTTQASYDAIEAEIMRLHSYDEPAIITVPVTGGSTSYLSWIAENADPDKQG